MSEERRGGRRGRGEERVEGGREMCRERGGGGAAGGYTFLDSGGKGANKEEGWGGAGWGRIEEEEEECGRYI